MLYYDVRADGELEMPIEFTRFNVKAGKSQKVDEWLAFLHDNMEEVLVTLEDGQDVDSSTHWIDEKHLAYWDECIDPTFRPVDLVTEVVMIPGNVREVMTS